MQACISEGLFENYNLLEIDFRINVLARNIRKNFNIINSEITFSALKKKTITATHKYINTNL